VQARQPLHRLIITLSIARLVCSGKSGNSGGSALGSSAEANSLTLVGQPVDPDPLKAERERVYARDWAHIKRVIPQLVSNQKAGVATHSNTCRGIGEGNEIVCTSTGAVFCSAHADQDQQNWTCTYGDFAQTNARIYCHDDYYGGAYCNDGSFATIRASCTRIAGVLPFPTEDGYCEWTPPDTQLSLGEPRDFPDTSVGASTEKISTITNNSDVARTITAVTLNTAASPYTIASDGCTGVILQSSQICTVAVTFTPTAVGLTSNALRVTYDSSFSPALDPFSGRGIAAAAGTLTGPSSLAFGGAIAGEEELSGEIQLSIATTSSLTISALSVSNSAFRVASSNCIGTYTSNQTCQIRLVFSPTTVGLISGSLLVTYSSLNSPLSIALSGEGVAGGGVIALSPKQLTFSPREIGGAGELRQFEVKNIGTGLLRIGQASYGTDFQLVNSSCAGALEPGGTCQLGLRFLPQGGGVKAATLRVFNQSQSQSATATLIGLGRPVEECKP
jgi:hypothetical protein